MKKGILAFLQVLQLKCQVNIKVIYTDKTVHFVANDLLFCVTLFRHKCNKFRVPFKRFFFFPNGTINFLNLILVHVLTLPSVEDKLFESYTCTYIAVSRR